MNRILFFVLSLIMQANIALAQSPANLIADQIDVLADGTLVASGNVIFWQGDQVAKATSIRYNNDLGTLSITGPIELTVDASTKILADQADLSDDFTSGIIKGAKLLLDQKLQVAATQINRIEGRYNQAYKVAATSCSVCGNEIPLWQIRAKRFVHDTAEKQLHFNNVQLRLLGVPVFYLPYLRLPDPTLKRATGFLVPEYYSNTLLGFGVKLPYFIVLADDKDLTLTPLITSKSKGVFYRYRQVFDHGKLTVSGAFARDLLKPDGTRGHFRLDGNSDFKNGYNLTYGLQAVSDPSFNSTYGTGLSQRLVSGMALKRTDSDHHNDFNARVYHSTRASDDNLTLPTWIAEMEMNRRIRLQNFGNLDWHWGLHTSRRRSDLDVDGPDRDTEVDGMDLARLDANLTWSDSHTFRNGMILEGQATADITAYNVNQNRDFKSKFLNARATTAAKLSWPLVRQNQFGGTDVFVPKIGYSFATSPQNENPNLDSTRIEFDQGNLFSVDQSPGHDVKFHGSAVNIGFDWRRQTQSGQTFDVSLGRIFRDHDHDRLAQSSGLANRSSDNILALGYHNASGISLLSRAIINDKGKFRKAETNLSLNKQKYSLSLTQTWLEADPDLNRELAFSQILANGSVRLSDNLSLNAAARYDARLKTLNKISSTITYTMSCLKMDFSVSRTLSSSANVPSVTEYGVKIDMAQFGINSPQRRSHRSCGGNI